jgi:hypothetical protein
MHQLEARAPDLFPAASSAKRADGFSQRRFDPGMKAEGAQETYADIDARDYGVEDDCAGPEAASEISEGRTTFVRRSGFSSVAKQVLEAINRSSSPLQAHQTDSLTKISLPSWPTKKRPLALLRVCGTRLPGIVTKHRANEHCVVQRC